MRWSNMNKVREGEEVMAEKGVAFHAQCTAAEYAATFCPQDSNEDPRRFAGCYQEKMCSNLMLKVLTIRV